MIRTDINTMNCAPLTSIQPWHALQPGLEHAIHGSRHVRLSAWLPGHASLLLPWATLVTITIARQLLRVCDLQNDLFHENTTPWMPSPRQKNNKVFSYQWTVGHLHHEYTQTHMYMYTHVDHTQIHRDITHFYSFMQAYRHARSQEDQKEGKEK